MQVIDCCYISSDPFTLALVVLPACNMLHVRVTYGEESRGMEENVNRGVTPSLWLCANQIHSQVAINIQKTQLRFTSVNTLMLKKYFVSMNFNIHHFIGEVPLLRCRLLILEVTLLPYHATEGS